MSSFLYNKKYALCLSFYHIKKYSTLNTNFKFSVLSSVDFFVSTVSVIKTSVNLFKNSYYKVKCVYMRKYTKRLFVESSIGLILLNLLNHVIYCEREYSL